jgi:MFS family permease
MPLAWLTFGLNYVLGGMDPWGYHAVNLVLHGASTALFFLVAVHVLAAVAAGHDEDRIPRPGAGRRHPPTFAITAGAGLAALVFGLHPQRVEPVAWVIGRSILLSGFFYLLAALAYLRSTGGDGGIRWRWWGAASLTALVAAVLSHPLAMTLPLTLLVLDVYPLRRHRRSRTWLSEKVPFALVAAAAAGLAVLARQRGVLRTEAAARDVGERLAFAGKSLWFYPSTFVWPAGLSPLYELPDRVVLSDPGLLAPLLGGAAAFLALLGARRRLPGGLAAWLHMAIVVAPVSGLVYSGIQLGADRYTYLADLGFALLVGSGLFWALTMRAAGRLSGAIVRMIGVAAVALVLVLGAGSWSYAAIWHDSETLWRWAVDVDADCAMCHVHLSEAVVSRAARQGPEAVRARAPEAEAYARRALTLRADLADAYFNLGTVLAAQHRYDEADVALRAYMARAPWDPTGPWRLGVLRLVQQRPTEAAALLRRALAMAPGSNSLRLQLADALHQQAAELERLGRHSEARALREEHTRLVNHGARSGPASP